MNMHLREGRSYAREFVEVPGGFRRTVEDAIEALICVLDQLDADPDLENGGCDEPTLGWPNAMEGRGAIGLRNDPPFDDGEFEPTLGWNEAEAKWGARYQPLDECEDVSEDEGAQCDDEGDREIDADLGWPEAGAGLIPLAGFFGDGEENLTAPETSGGFVCIPQKRADPPTLRILSRGEVIAFPR